MFSESSRFAKSPEGNGFLSNQEKREVTTGRLEALLKDLATDFNRKFSDEFNIPDLLNDECGIQKKILW